MATADDKVCKHFHMLELKQCLFAQLHTLFIQSLSEQWRLTR